MAFLRTIESDWPFGDIAVCNIKDITPRTNRQLLELLAPQISPSGVLHIGGVAHLVFSDKPYGVGTPFTVKFRGQEYKLELAAVDEEKFTLRYAGEEITRPIKPVK